MSAEDFDNAVDYVRNCIELNPDAGSLTSAKEYCQDFHIPHTTDDLEQIAFEALYH